MSDWIAARDAATAETRSLSDEELRARIVQRAFGGDPARLDAFVGVLREAIPPDVSVVLRGSVVTGVRWADGQAFDGDGKGTSDLDLTLVGGDMLKLWSDFHIPALHSVPLNDDNPEACPTFVPLRRSLCAMVGRPVNIQATSDLVQYGRDVLMDQPYYTLIDRDDRVAEREAWEREREAARERAQAAEQDAA